MRVREVVAPCRIQLPSKTPGGYGPTYDVDEIRVSADQTSVAFYLRGELVYVASDEFGTRTMEVVT